MDTESISPSREDLETFKNLVKLYIDVTTETKKIQQTLREKNTLKKELTKKITNFMSMYKYEECNFKDGGILKYKVRQVKVQPKTTEIKNNLIQHFSTDTTAEELAKKIFEPKAIEKHSLLRSGTRSIVF